ncbi:MAG: fibronectin type III domain-containing protein [Deltaproteobacteria bacterium]|nr:fibronectin type III domain-containing protein [Deltaproteobacteria bacterium]
MKLPLLPDNLTSTTRIWLGPFLLMGFLLLLPGLCHATRKVTLAWDANQETTVIGYRVFCRKASDGYNYRHPIWDSTATTCTLIGLDEYTDYAFVVRAYDYSGNQSADSQEVWYTAGPPCRASRKPPRLKQFPRSFPDPRSPDGRFHFTGPQ